MTFSKLLPPLTPIQELTQSLQGDGFAIISARDVAQIAGVDLDQLLSLNQFLIGFRFNRNAGT
jgi:hypothetical protein